MNIQTIAALCNDLVRWKVGDRYLIHTEYFIKQTIVEYISQQRNNCIIRSATSITGLRQSPIWSLTDAQGHRAAKTPGSRSSSVTPPGQDPLMTWAEDCSIRCQSKHDISRVHRELEIVSEPTCFRRSELVTSQAMLQPQLSGLPGERGRGVLTSRNAQQDGL